MFSFCFIEFYYQNMFFQNVVIIEDLKTCFLVISQVYENMRWLTVTASLSVSIRMKME